MQMAVKALLDAVFFHSIEELRDDLLAENRWVMQEQDLLIFRRGGRQRAPDTAQLPGR